MHQHKMPVLALGGDWKARRQKARTAEAQCRKGGVLRSVACLQVKLGGIALVL
jgi:hypothetical protein